MAFIEWTDDYSVLNQQMDDQHQILFGYVNEFHDALVNNASRDELQEIYEKVIAFTDFHFKDEERLMKETGYPDYDIHKQVHVNLIEEAIGYQDMLKQGVAGVEDKITYFFKVWLTAHIKGIDKKYSAHVNQHKKAS